MISIGGADHYKAFSPSNFKVDKEQGNVVHNVTREQLQPELAQPISRRMSRKWWKINCRRSKRQSPENPKRVNVSAVAHWAKATRATPVLLASNTRGGRLSAKASASRYWSITAVRDIRH